MTVLPIIHAVSCLAMTHVDKCSCTALQHSRYSSSSKLIVPVAHQEEGTLSNVTWLSCAGTKHMTHFDLELGMQSMPFLYC